MASIQAFGIRGVELSLMGESVDVLLRWHYKVMESLGELRVAFG